jgi:hypothetical protein
MKLAMHRKTFVEFPALDGADVALEIGGYGLPGIQPFAIAA